METLGISEIEKLYEGLPNEIAKMLSQKLQNKYFIHNDYIYVLDEDTIAYKKESKVKDTIITATSELIENSFYKLSNDTQELIKLKYKSTFKSIFHSKTIEKYYLPLIKQLTKENIEIDVTLREIHFKNGYIDLNDNSFLKRETSKHYITRYINRNYCKSTEDQKTEMMKLIKQIYPKEVNRNCILRVFGSALTGESIKDQTYLFLLGAGSSGKSSMMLITKEAFEIYVKSLKDDTLTQNNQKADKIFNTFGKSPYIRFIWINEPKDKRMDAELFKQLVEGTIETTMLYQEGSHEQRHYAKVITTMNNMLKIKIDTGTGRRIQAYTHTSLFTEDETILNDNKFIYKKDKNLLQNLKNNNLLNAWVDILATEAYEWLKNPVINYPKDFCDTKNDIISDNDVIGEFFENNVIITGNPEDRLSLEDIYSEFKNNYPNNLTSPKTFKNNLVFSRNIKYERDLFVLGTKKRGVFMGLKLKNNEGVSKDEATPLPNEYTDIKKANQRIKQLEDYVKELTNKLETSITQIEPIKINVIDEETKLPTEGVGKTGFAKPITKRKKVIVKNTKLDDKIVKNEEQFIEEFSNLIN